MLYHRLFETQLIASAYRLETFANHYTLVQQYPVDQGSQVE
jgi:hypothetical protein